jgi:2-dehydro-3-deoxyphosphogluconate aldolase / (4S)-4-hydroxy-2-oxoglutarate aldolase
MARFTRIQVVLQMKESGIIPVFYHPDKEVCLSVIKACYEGGLRLFEFTNRGDFAHELFSDLNKIVIKEMPEMILGTGSVVDAGTASLYIQLGSNFIVSPVLKEEMAQVCNRRKILWSPGCGSVTEISHAEELGAEIVKIFPAPSVGGPEFVKTVRGPQPWTNIMPTGGVDPTEESLKTWFDAGVYCVGMGSNLITPGILKNKDWKLLKDNVSALVALYKKIRK